MDVLITETNRTEYGTYLSAICGKVNAFVSFYKDGDLRVCCKNASHRVWKGAGRGFANAKEALDAYKSPEMKAIIRAAMLNDAGIGPEVPAPVAA